MIAVLEELGVRDSFDVRAVRETAEFLCARTSWRNMGVTTM